MPTPSSGGLAIFLSCAAAYWLVCPGRYPRIALAVAALWIFGFLDDRLRLPPLLKLAVQVTAAGFVVLGGVVFPAHSVVSAERGPQHVLDRDDHQCLQPDRQHGRAVRRSGDHHLPVPLLAADSEGYRADANLCAILAAAFAGFLIFNYHPARIFMGDCGSLPAGFALGALTLAGPAPHKGLLLAGFCYPALTFAYPIFDTALVSILRKLAGRPISVGGRDHSSHRLASLGLDQRQVVWILWLLTAFGSSLGIMIHWMPDALFAAGALLLGLFGIVRDCLWQRCRDIRCRPGYPGARVRPRELERGQAKADFTW